MEENEKLILKLIFSGENTVRDLSRSANLCLLTTRRKIKKLEENGLILKIKVPRRNNKLKYWGTPVFVLTENGTTLLKTKDTV